MADLEVQPKKRTPWWLWLLLLLIIAALIYYFTKGRNQLATVNTSNTDSTTTTTTTQTVIADTSAWTGVNFNGSAAKYDEVTDTAVHVSESGKYIVYSLGENILFANGQTAIQGSADARLKQIAASLNQRYKDARIGVFGRTDSTGSAGQNQQLGAERAEAVKNWLVKNGSIQAANVSVHSLGESQPVASNSTAGGRQQNRSVEIVAIRDSSNAQ